jgi:hypothetical protein
LLALNIESLASFTGMQLVPNYDVE